MGTLTNEGLCCDAVLRILEEEHGAKQCDVVADTAERRGVEVTCTIGGQHYAIEHTLIEPFHDNQRDNITFSRVFDAEFEASLRDLLRPHLTYNVYVDVYAFQDMSARQLMTMRAALLAWVRAAMPKLLEPKPGGFVEMRINSAPPEAPIRVTLACHRSTLHGGQLVAGRYAPVDLEALRKRRLLKALQDKGPKLHAARCGNTRTVLVFENFDFAITNEGLVSAAIDEVAAQVEHMPDDVYLVDTRDGRWFHVTQVRRTGRACVLMGGRLGDWQYAATDLRGI